MDFGVGAVIVAAGLSSRMGAYKPLIEIGGVTVARRVVGAFAEAGVSPIVVVTGYRADELEAHLSEESDVLFVRNEDYATSAMYDSAKIGLSYILGRCARAFFCPVDVPLFTEDTVRRLMAAGAPVVKPAYGGREGHPILVDENLIPALIGLGRTCGATTPPQAPDSGPQPNEGPLPDGKLPPGSEPSPKEGGLALALSAFKNVTEVVDVDDEGILHDADTPDDQFELKS
jgi:CTP:molybdopterin cytidylyltransferase MocA